MSHGDIGIWVIKLKKMGIKEFRLRDLPEDLQITGMIRKARELGIIKRVENRGSHSIWRFEDRDRIK